MAKKMGQNEASSSKSRSRGESLVIDHGRRRSSCGYCKSKEFTSFVHGLWAQRITVDDYQDLLDRGWRRSGSFLYKPEMEKTCCPSYTIRLNVNDFVPSKEQIRISRRMQRYLDGTYDVKKRGQANESSSAMDEQLVRRESSADNINEKDKTEEYIHYLSNKIDNIISLCVQRGEFPSIQLPKAVVKRVTPQAKKKLHDISGDLLYTSNISFQIAAALRRSASSKDDVLRNGQPLELSQKTIAERLASVLDQEGELSGLSIQACNGHLNFYSSILENASAEVHVAVNASSQSNKLINEASTKHESMLTDHAIPPRKRQRLEIRMKCSSFDPEEYALYRRYQIQVHNDKPDEVMESSYRRFLVDTPLTFVPPSGDNTVPPCGFGSFHQQYVIDGKLVAVGVVDVLPRCLSSKYLFWDPDLAALSLGKYSALQEISWVGESHLHCPSLQYYYLGYYIHSCSKMRYKAAYRPSELLCPLRYQWVPFDIAKPLLDKEAYVVLSDFAKLENGVSTALPVPERTVEQTCIKSCHEDLNEALSDDNDEEMETDFEGSDIRFDDDSGSEETSSLASVDEMKALDVSNITIDLNGTRLKFKDLLQIFHPSRKRFMDSLEQQLHRYVRAVGVELAHRMVYSLS